MAEYIGEIRHLTTTVYNPDGTVARTINSVDYCLRDTVNPDLQAWQEDGRPDVDATRTLTAQRDQTKADARARHGIPARP